ncbi:hypothetical protein KA005_62790 [bacterium]|nr:hypothetical protein [bacterium]
MYKGGTKIVVDTVGKNGKTDRPKGITGRNTVIEKRKVLGVLSGFCLPKAGTTIDREGHAILAIIDPPVHLVFAKGAIDRDWRDKHSWNCFAGSLLCQHLVFLE